MTNEQRMNLLNLVFTTIFQSKQSNTDITQIMVATNMGQFPGRWFRDSSTGQQTLRGFDFACNLGDRIINLRCIEQNPNKTDNLGNLKKFAVLARQGHRIMWVINTAGGFLGRIQDDEWHPSFQPATQPATYHNPAASPNPAAAHEQNLAQGLVPDDLPEIPSDGDIPDHVLQSVAEMEEPPDWENYG